MSVTAPYIGLAVLLIISQTGVLDICSDGVFDLLSSLCRLIYGAYGGTACEVGMELNFKLTEFEGPLDLLLHLIDKAQIAIEDIFVSDITEQYLEYVNTLPEINMESASEFLATAAMLLEIKSRRLLPKPPKPEEDEEDPEQVLIRRLQEYKRIKENAVILRAREGELEGMYFKSRRNIALTSVLSWRMFQWRRS